jgi:hypothetical protein
MTARPDGWHLDSERLVLDFYESGAFQYEVDLERCDTCARLLDGIMQVAGKADEFISDVQLGRFVRLVDALLDPQGTLCGFGQDRGRIDVRKVIARTTRRGGAA